MKSNLSVLADSTSEKDSQNDDTQKRLDDLQMLLEPQIRRKQKMCRKYGRNLSPKSLRKERNKEYSRINRKRKKEYVSVLESRVSELEDKVTSLSEQLLHYKNKVAALTSGYERDYSESSTYFDNDFIEFLRTASPKDGGARFKEVCSVYGPNGEDRIKLLKFHFKHIIDILLPDSLRCFMALLREESKATDEEYDQITKMNRISAISELHDPKFSLSDKVFYEIGVCTTSRNGMMKHCPAVQKYLKIYHEVVHEIINMRNRILNIQSDWHDEFELDYDNLPANDFANLFQYFKKVIFEPMYSTHAIWDVKKKSPFEPSKDGYLSEEEIEF